MVLLRRAAAAPVSDADLVTITGSAPAVKLPRNSRDLHAFAPDCPALAIGIAWKIKAASRVDAAAAAGVAAAMAAAAAAAAAAAGIATTLAAAAANASPTALGSPLPLLLLPVAGDFRQLLQSTAA